MVYFNSNFIQFHLIPSTPFKADLILGLWALNLVHIPVSSDLKRRAPRPVRVPLKSPSHFGQVIISSI